MKNLYLLILALFVPFTFNAQIIDIPDANFKAALIERDVDTNSDGEIQISEAEAWTQTLYLDNKNITSLEGIQYFTNTSYFSCNNNQLTSIDLSGLNNLVYFSCRNNMITSLNVENNPLLASLYCHNNLITNLNLDNNPLLENLRCNDNLISTLDLTNQPNLVSVEIYNNQITELTFGTILGDVSSGAVFTLSASNNLLTTLDLSSVHREQHTINVSNNNLTTLILKNGAANVYDFPELFGEVILTNNPDLSFVCVDEFERSFIQGKVNGAGLTNCVVNSYCTFPSGGDYNTILGKTFFDLDNNGCDNSDLVPSNFVYTISGGSSSGSIISNDLGEYAFYLGNGTYTCSPTLENPAYFSVTPSNITVNFPSNTSPFIQDFCITPNGTHNDLEITLIPLEAARPGFDTYYKLIYKNKGTTTLSGSVALNYQDDIMDVVSASPIEDSQTSNLLSWNFADMTPFENREIVVGFNINAPTETPAVNNGDVLSFNATVNTSQTDETPDDNVSNLNQTVVNSLDPNDKTCLEGDFITPEMAGKFVHYMIRFENTGTANAINVVVKDDIDISKYDLSTLVPLHSSYDYVARIKNQGTSRYVEFIFENINLPFDDANNDGYVTFKIKTLGTLGLGDSFQNDAEIYFDFNFPIVTNNATTTITTLSVDEFEQANANVVIFPNPTTNIIHLTAKQSIEKVNIYDISGRIIQNIAVIGSKTSIDFRTESLNSGTYFVKIETKNGAVVKKIIKD